MRPESEVERQLCERILKSFLDVLILSGLEKSVAKGGHDFVKLIHKEFGILISAGTVYPSLYTLEREGFIKGYSTSRKRVYKITDKGKLFIEVAHNAINLVQNWTEKIMKKPRT